MTTQDRFRDFLKKRHDFGLQTQPIGREKAEASVRFLYDWLHRCSDGKELKNVIFVPSIASMLKVDITPPKEDSALASAIRRETWLAAVSSESAERDDQEAADLLHIKTELFYQHDFVNIINHELAEFAQKHKLPLWYSQYDVGFLALCDYLIDKYDPTDVENDMFWACRAFIDVFNDSYVVLFGEEEAVVCERPEKYVVDDFTRLHSVQKGTFAVQFRDGTGYYASRNTIVPTKWIEEGVDKDTVMNERNAELRRVALGLYGEENFLKSVKAWVVDEAEEPFGTLYRFTDPQDNIDKGMLRVINPTRDADGSSRVHWLMVHTQHETVKDAWFSTFRLRNLGKAPEVRR